MVRCGSGGVLLSGRSREEMQRRRRIWILTLAFAVLAIAGVPLTVALQRAASQREAVQALRDLGAVVCYDYHFDEDFRRALPKII